MEQVMAEKRKHAGGCHCGAIRFEIETALEQAMSCNCSYCQKRGSLLTFVPRAHFNLLAGEHALTDYQFNHKVIHHLFCASCGIGSFGRGTGSDGVEMVAVNVRCLDGVDLDALKVTPFDGKSL
jgi:hypothetical protein